MTEETALDDAQLPQGIIGEPFSSTIVIADYDEQWPTLFTREAERVRGLLGAAALVIEHVGSTSVPGLPAKAIIDIDLIVEDSSDEASYVPALEAGGYVLRIRESDWHEHRMFKGPDTNVNLHVYSRGCEELDRQVLLRNWMRTHPEDRDLYAQTKRELAERDWESVNEYSDAKGDVIGAMLARAGWKSDGD
jgi:GrpB-like predicted nucleotidyltransferase (UPF0157 family)